MEDIRLAIALIGFLSIAIFAVTYRLLRRRSKLFLDLMAVVVVVLTVAYVNIVWGQLWIVNWIPLPSVVVLSNWFPLLLGALAATVWLRLEPASIARRAPVMLVMLAAGIYSVMYFVPAKAPPCEDRWAPPPPPLQHSVCLQTTPYTCSAASSATILQALGIEASEQEMARLCLTRHGTTWLGLYHGLATKLMGTEYDVQFFEAHPSDLPDMSREFPLLLCCELNASAASMAPEYVTDGGWKPDVAHSVVYFGFAEELDKHIIGDPSRGYEGWTGQDLNILWTGTGLRIRYRKK